MNTSNKVKNKTKERQVKSLKIWNGGGCCCRKYDDPRWTNLRDVHAYVCAHSRADARRVIQEYCGNLPSDSEIEIYWSAGCWGNSMNGITPKRGLWLEFGRNTRPVKVI